MSNYSNGLATKNRILDVCRDLFINFGYKDTPFGEICRISEVNPGSISYHFGSKRNIASIIYKETMHHLNERAAQLFTEEDSLQQIMIALGIHISLLFDYPKYRLFSAQYLSEGAYDDNLMDYIDVVPEAYDVTAQYIHKEKSDFLFAAFLGMDGHIESYIDMHIDELKFENILRYYFELHYLFLNQQELEDRIEKIFYQLDELTIMIDGFDIIINKNI